MTINKNIKKTTSHLRFRRWSRKPYAIFIGLSIGTLTKGVIDKLLPKTNPFVIIVANGSHLSLQEKSMDEVLSHESEISLPLITTCISIG